VPQFRPGVLKRTVRGYTGSTPYARVGNWLMVGLAVVALAAALAAALLRKAAQGAG
jgi:apolipoprotein N-acyltransferase